MAVVYNKADYTSYIAYTPEEIRDDKVLPKLTLGETYYEISKPPRGCEAGVEVKKEVKLVAFYPYHILLQRETKDVFGNKRYYYYSVTYIDLYTNQVKLRKRKEKNGDISGQVSS